MNADQMKDWAWSWAAKLDADITRTMEWFSEVSGMAAGSPVTAADAYQTALSWTVAAYYEYKKGRWSRERSEAQISEAVAMIEMLGGSFIVTNKQPIFLAEYSPEQKCCHIDTLDRCVEVNLQSVIAGQPASFIPLGYFNDHSGAQKFLEAICDKLPIGEAVREENFNG